MITAQDIREKAFEKVRINGYDMAAVDDFLEELADDVSNSQKENAVLKSKMKVLVDKIEEYRSNEEALNLAVLSAQKLAVQIEAEARARAAAMLADAERQVKEQVGSITSRVEEEQKRLSDAQTASAKFFDGIRAMCNAQLKHIDAISGNYVPQPEAPQAAGQDDVDETVRTIEKTVSRIQPEPSIEFDLESAIKTPAKPRKGFDSTQPFTL